MIEEFLMTQALAYDIEANQAKLIIQSKDGEFEVRAALIEQVPESDFEGDYDRWAAIKADFPFLPENGCRVVLTMPSEDVIYQLMRVDEKIPGILELKLGKRITPRP